MNLCITQWKCLRFSIRMVVSNVSRASLLHCFFFDSLQTQLSHGFPYSDRRSDYGGTIGVGSGGPGNRLHEHDPLSLHQALQSSVDDGQNTGMDENASFMSDLPLLKSKFLILVTSVG